MSSQQRIEPETLLSLQKAYIELEGSTDAISSYLQQNCRLDNAIGLLLLWLKPLFDQGRDQAFQAFRDAADGLRALSVQVNGALQDAEKLEQQHVDDIQQILKKLDDLTQSVHNLENRAPAGGGYSGGGSSGGGGYGGGFTPVSPGAGASISTPPPAAAAPATTTPPPSPSSAQATPTTTPPISITVNIDDRDTTVSVGDGNTGTVTVEGAHATGDATASDGSTAATVDAMGIPVSTPEQQAHEAALYEKIWADLAAEDPLHRSAEALRAAWESREAITIPDATAGQTSIGFASDATAATTSGAETVRLLIDIPADGSAPSVQIAANKGASSWAR